MTELELQVAQGPEVNVDLVAGEVLVTVAAAPVEIDVEFIGVPGVPGPPGSDDLSTHFGTMNSDTVTIDGGLL